MLISDLLFGWVPLFCFSIPRASASFPAPLIYNLLPAGQAATPRHGGGVGKIGNTELEWNMVILANEEREDEERKARQKGQSSSMKTAEVRMVGWMPK